MGAKVGKRCYIDTTDLTEHDLVTIGDDVALNDYAGLQTHLFEDRVMKVGAIRSATAPPSGRSPSFSTTLKSARRAAGRSVGGDEGRDAARRHELGRQPGADRDRGMIPLRHDGPLDRLAWDGARRSCGARPIRDAANERRWRRPCYPDWRKPR